MTTGVSKNVKAASSAIQIDLAPQPRWLNMGSILFNEIQKGLIIQWSYKFNMVTELVMLAFLFVGISFFMGGGTLDADNLAPALIGYSMWFYVTIALSSMSWSLREEAQQGTLEQMYMSTAPATLIQIGRSLSTVLVTTFMVLCISIPMIFALNIELPFRLAALPVFILTMFGAYGFSFMVGGATLLFKQVGSLANLIQNVMLFLNGAFLPIEHLPPWMVVIAQTLPTTQGIIVLRNVILDGQSLSSAWIDGSLSWLVIHSTLYFVSGLLVFAYCERKAKQKGLLGQY
ncbi:MAG: ABC transporter permease [Chloroflexota bacterium]